MKKFKEINIHDQQIRIAQINRFADQFSHAAVLTSNQYPDRYGKFELIAGIGAKRIFTSNENSFEELKKFYDKVPSWLFGHFSYDLKNQLERLESRHSPKFNFDEVSFFEPLYLFLQKKASNTLEIWLNEGAQINDVEDFLSTLPAIEKRYSPFPPLKAKQNKAEYLHRIAQLQEEIQFGNIYEINYCTEFFAEECELEANQVFEQLNEQSPMPFGAFYKQETDYLLCASPERFIKKEGAAIISQPIKGTAKRGKDKQEDERIIQLLKSDLKEQTENVMIVDIVRNDLSKTAARNSVQVKELMGVYTFPQVHQMISTVGSELSHDLHFLDVIKEAFPMGSMTGAPKISAMKLADQHESSRRELYSGSIGYIEPNGDFDFNVVIRSLFYSSKTKYLSVMVGGAITAMSDAEEEYKECLLKAKAIFDLNKVE